MRAVALARALLGALAGALLLTLGATHALANPDADPCRPERLELVGDVEPNAHLDLERADGPPIRLAGVEPPVVRGGDADLAQTASEDLALWVIAGPLGLAPVRAEPDRWGRIVGRLFLRNDGAAPHRLPSLSEALVDAGLARVDPATETGACLERLYAAEVRARAGRRGLWEEPQFAVIDAASPPDLTRRAGRMVIVQGRVASVRAGRGPTFVNFGADSAASVSLVIERDVARAMERAKVAPGSLAGKDIRARGALDLSRAPRVLIEAPGAVEVISGVPAGRRTKL